MAFLACILFCGAASEADSRAGETFKGEKTLAASIVVTMVTLIILSVLLYVGYMAFRELKDFIANFDENINSLDGQFKLVCCRIDGWIKLKEGCSYAFFENVKG